MYLGEAAKAIKFWNLLIPLLGAIPALFIVTRKWRRETREKLSLLDEANPGAYREAFRDHALHKSLVQAYVQDVFPFRVEPLEDGFILERYRRSETRESSLVLRFILMILILFGMSLALTSYLILYTDDILMSARTATLFWGTGILLLAGGVFSVRSVLRERRLNLSLADKFAKVIGEEQ